MTFYFDRPPTGVSAQQLIDAGAAEPITFAALTPAAFALGGVGYGKSALISSTAVEVDGKLGILDYAPKAEPGQIPDLAVVDDEPVTAGPDDEPTDDPDTDWDPESAA